MSDLSEELNFVNRELQIQQNWSRLQSYLMSVGHNLCLQNEPRQFSAGFGNLNYLVNFDGVSAVLRRPPMGPLQPGANDMLREGKILRSLSCSFPLSPGCLFIGDTTEVLGTPFLILEYRPGIVIGSTLPVRWMKNQTVPKKITEHLLEMLINLHNISPAEVGLLDLGSPEGYLARTANGWFKRAQLMWSTDLPITVNYIMAWLNHNMIVEQPPVLLHNDFKLDNVIFNPDNLEPIALIDWDMGTRGDPLWDLAVLLSYWTEPHDPAAMLQLGQMPTTFPGFLKRKQIIDLYGSRSGRDISNIRYYRVLAQFRLAVVFKQIYEKYKNDPNSNARTSKFDSLSRGLLEFATEVARGTYD